MGLLDLCPLETWKTLEKAQAVSRFIQAQVEKIVEH